MPFKKNHHKIGLVLSLFVLIMLFMPVQVLSLQGLPGDEIWLKVDRGDQLVYAYKHSVSRTMVFETYQVSELASLVLLSIQYSDQGGAGLPDILPPGAKYETESGMMVQKDLNRSIKSMVFQVDQVYLNSIKYKQEEYKLYGLVESNHGRVRIAVSYQPRILTLFNK